jgi:hypothetical protein
MNQYKNPSVSIKLSTVKDYAADAILQGDSPYVPVFDAVTDTLSNSIIQQNSNNPIDGISIGGAIDAVTNIAASGNLVAQGDITGGNNIDIGGTNTVSGSRSGTIGKENTVAGDDAFSAGHSAHALGNDSISLGHGTSAAGHGSFAAGFYASAGNEGAASYTASVTSTTFTVDNLVGTLTTGMYVYPFNINERKEITNVVDNGDGTYDITVAGGAVTTYENTRVYFESATPDRNDSYGTIALGNEATSIGNNSVAIGYKATATTSNEVVIGSGAADTTIGGDLDVVGNLSITGAVSGTSFAEITSGTWTPTLGTNPGGSIVYTYTTQTGNWYAVGDMVIANFQIIGTAQGVSSSDIVTISMPHDPAYDEPGGTVYDAGTGFSVKPIGFGRSFSSSHAGASLLGVSGEVLTAAEVNFAQQFNILGQLIYKK